MATEIGTAYLSIVASTDGIPRQIRSALGESGNIAEREGRNAGGRMSGALGKTLKVGAVAAATTAGAAMGVALTKGFERLTSIDDAKGKLAGLGHTTESTAKIMDSALASVKGTAYGLGDAATIAAGAVAAGVKPGKDLTKYLKTTADAASIAGSSLDEMGSILNQVQTGQQAYTDDLNQLADRGIPIYQWLGKEMGVAASEVKGLAAEGKVSSEIFFAAIQKNIGGAALASGKTVKGSFANMMAAMGRLGAAAEGPMFKRLPATFMSITDSIDAATPAVAAFAAALDTKVFDEWVPKAQDAWEALSGNENVRGGIDRVRNVLESVGHVASDAWPAIKQIAASLGEASAALGVSGWTLFVTALEAGAGVLNAIVPLLDVLAGLMSSNQGAVTALAAAFLLFKTVPMLLGRVSGAVAPMGRSVGAANGHLRQAAVSMAAITTASGAMVRGAAGTSMAMGRFGSSIAQIGRSVPAIASMQSAFVTATNQAARFGRTAGTVSAGMAGISAAGKGMVSALGGGANVALMGAVVAIGLFASSSQSARSAQQNYDRALQNTEKSQVSLTEALRDSRGAMDDQAIDALTQRISNVGAEFEAVEGKRQSFMNALGDASTWKQAITLGIADSDYDKTNAAADQAKASREAIESLGMSSETMAARVSGSTAAWAQFRQALVNAGEGGEAAAAKFDVVREQLESARGAAQRATPGMAELQGAMQKFSDSTATAADKSSALKTALDALNPDRTASEALAAHNEVIREVTKSSQEAADASLGFGDSLGGVRGIIEGTTENGGALRQSIMGIVDATTAAASSGKDMTEVNKKNQEAFGALATQYGVDIGQIQGAADRLGLSDIDLVVDMSNAGVVTQELMAIQRGFDNLGEGQTELVVDASQVAGSRAQLEAMGFTIANLPNGQVGLTANDAASPVLRAVTDLVTQYDGKIGIADIDLNKMTFDLKNGQALNQLATMDRTNVSPEAGLIIDRLLQGKAVSMAELDVLNRTKANPQADMAIAAIMEKIGIVNNGLDNAARARTAEIAVVTREYNANPSVGRELDRRLATRDGNANGSIRQYANGGISNLPDQALIQRPDPNGGLVQWAEPETGGEVFIPLASGKRTRSLSIWRKAGALLGANFQEYADGGIRADDFDKLARGEIGGASGPLTGSPYNWGGVNWGDCSGAMSAFARFAAGLPVWAGRFATSSMQAALQAMGAVMGRGSSGDLRFGWTNGGPGGGHTAGTLPSGKNVEMGGGYGGGMYGGTVGADDAQFSDHAYFPSSMFGPSWTDPGSDPGGFVMRPDGTYGPVGDGNYGAGGGGTAEQSPEQKIASSISENFGNAASSFVKGQTSDALGVFGLSDSPGWLGAISKYQEDNPKSNGSGSRAGGQPKVSDPGMQKPKPGEDMPPSAATPAAPQASAPPAPGFTPTGDPVKDAVKKAFQSLGWADGAPWDATDFIVNKESTWNPLARNASSGAFGLFQFLGSTKDQYLPDENPDPFIQGQAGGAYIGDRYGDPEKAKAFWDQNGWYDEGGWLQPGTTLVRNDTGKPEPVLNPAQWDAMKNGGGENHYHYEQVIHNPTFSDRDGLMRSHDKHVTRQMSRFGG